MSGSLSPCFYQSVLCLIFLISPFLFFSFNRCSLDARVGFVFVRAFGGISALRTASTNRWIASWRFCSWVRNRFASINRTPSLLMRLPASWTRRALTSSGSEEARTSNRNCTAVATLLTFCPPGPEARIKSIWSSRSSICREGVISIIIIIAPTPAPPFSEGQKWGRVPKAGGGSEHQRIDLVDHRGRGSQVCFLKAVQRRIDEVVRLSQGWLIRGNVDQAGRQPVVALSFVEHAQCFKAICGVVALFEILQKDDRSIMHGYFADFAFLHLFSEHDLLTRRD